MAQPLLLIHGMFCTGTELERLRTLFAARGYAVQVARLPFHDADAGPGAVAGQSLTDYVNALAEQVAAQNWAQAPVILGHSMGGLLAELLAARIPCTALVLLAPAPAAGQWFNPLPALPMYLPLLFRPGFWKQAYRPSAAAFARVALAGVPEQRHAGLYARTVAESGRAIAEIAFWPLDRAGAAKVDGRRVRCPVYAVSGGLDRLVPTTSVRRSLRRYPGATLRVWPERGHLLVDDEHTERMVEEIVSWLRPIERRAASRHTI